MRSTPRRAASPTKALRWRWRCSTRSRSGAGPRGCARSSRAPPTAHVYMAHVGAGWALARLRRGPRAARVARPAPRLARHRRLRLPPGLLRARAAPRRAPASRRASRATPAGVRPGTRPQPVVRDGRQPGPGCGRGAALPGGAPGRPLERRRAGCGLRGPGVPGRRSPLLRDAAGLDAAHLAQGAAFAAAAREHAGNPAAHTDLACRLLAGRSASDAAAMTTARARETCRPTAPSRPTRCGARGCARCSRRHSGEAAAPPRRARCSRRHSGEAAAPPRCAHRRARARRRRGCRQRRLVRRRGRSGRWLAIRLHRGRRCRPRRPQPPRTIRARQPERARHRRLDLLGRRGGRAHRPRRRRPRRRRLPRRPADRLGHRRPAPGHGRALRAVRARRRRRCRYDPATMAPMGCLPGDFDEDGRLDLLVYYWGRTPVLFLRAAAAATGRARSSAARRALEHERRDVRRRRRRRPRRTSSSATTSPTAPASSTRAPREPVAMQASMSRATNGGTDRILLWTAAGPLPRGARRARRARSPTAGRSRSAPRTSTATCCPSSTSPTTSGTDRLLLQPLDARPRAARRLVRGDARFDDARLEGARPRLVQGHGRRLRRPQRRRRARHLRQQHHRRVRARGEPLRLDQHGDRQRGRSPTRDRERAARPVAQRLGLGREARRLRQRRRARGADRRHRLRRAATINRWPELQELAIGNDELLSDPGHWPRFRRRDDLSGHEPERVLRARRRRPLPRRRRAASGVGPRAGLARHRDRRRRRRRPARLRGREPVAARRTCTCNRLPPRCGAFARRCGCVLPAGADGRATPARRRRRPRVRLPDGRALVPAGRRRQRPLGQAQPRAALRPRRATARRCGSTCAGATRDGRVAIARPRRSPPAGHTIRARRRRTRDEHRQQRRIAALRRFAIGHHRPQRPRPPVPRLRAVVGPAARRRWRRATRVELVLESGRRVGARRAAALPRRAARRSSTSCCPRTSPRWRSRCCSTPTTGSGRSCFAGVVAIGSKAILRAPVGERLAPLPQPVELRHRGHAAAVPVGRHRAAVPLHRERRRLGDWARARGHPRAPGRCSTPS